MTWLPLLLSGLAVGSIYALIGLALVIINKATDVVNFAQGEIAMFGTFVALSALNAAGLPVIVVLLLALPCGFLLGALLELVFIKPISDGPPLNVLIVTLGLFFMFNSLAGIVWGFDPYRFPSLFPTEPIAVAGAAVSPASLGIIAVTLVLMAALYLFFEHSRYGTAMRAASMNPFAARLMGIKVGRVATVSWGLAAGLSVVSGILIAPLTFVDQQMMISIILKGFAGAILGGFTSLPAAAAGCLLLGVTEAYVGTLATSTLKDSFAFALIILVLMLRPGGLFVKVARRKV
ncbi:amino acid/amide ABC transporter membrane protein 1, HAAT family [Tistlia consotensis]|uniref:Amino acid/amide ABC transporter membrane protein 1, HAAT family n=1 Tax=Tistlia consotensis USBA 355 TaxID=560819 RepID=A0A1Y6C6H6_9PROT|nr:branched-chain amino acid ABC transporter permease [Tistlia consotensis]SMF36899.1 amino acid/amide ABC transporter membrane protein 1, HAAT family [Tistlia consotensis USBA 355]SNR72301.1 amino acid/amide ABC transporter membrane protein 1, HAAT family [Tistlia consotensis]